MKLALIFGAAMVACASASAAEPRWEDLTNATAVRVVDQRVPAFRSTTNGLIPDMRSAGIIVTNSNTVTALIRAVQDAPGKWKRGSFTVPAGYKSFAFLRDSRLLGVIRLGDQFFVRGSGGHWEYKDITKELEAKINAIAQEGVPNKTRNVDNPE